MPSRREENEMADIRKSDAFGKEGWSQIIENGIQVGSIDPEGNEYRTPVAGDIIMLCGQKEYVFEYDEEDGTKTLCTNAVNRSWVNRNRRDYGAETYPLDDGFYQIVGHYGDGGLIDGDVWYEEEFQDDIEPQMSCY